METYITTQRTSDNVTVHIWGWIDGHGNGELHRIKERHTAASHHYMLEQETEVTPVAHVKNKLV